MSVALLLALSLAAAAKPGTLPTTVQDVQVQNELSHGAPGQFAYRVSAKVLVGANPCEANGVSVDLVKRLDAGVLELVPTRHIPPGPRPVCTREYLPVYRVVERFVSGRATDTQDVVLLNVMKLGTRTPVQEFLATSTTTSLDGVLEKIMGAGAESTGYAVELPSGESVELDLKTNGFERRAIDLFGRGVTVKGTYKTVTGVELTRRVLEVTALEIR